MIGKLIDLILKFAEMRYGPRAMLVRDIKSLHDNLEDCHQKYQALKNAPDDDLDGRSKAQQDHQASTAKLRRTLHRLEDVLVMHAPAGTWGHLNDYVVLEAAVHEPRELIHAMVNQSLRHSTPGDYESAIESLKKYIRDNLKPEEIHKDG